VQFSVVQRLLILPLDKDSNMERVKLKKTKSGVVPTWNKDVLFADCVLVGNCTGESGEVLVGLSMLAEDQSAICHVHFRVDMALQIYRQIGDAIMEASPPEYLQAGVA
jgi:hypothetical protein